MRISAFLLAAGVAFATFAQSLYTEPTADQITRLIGAVHEAGGEAGAYESAVARSAASLYSGSHPTYSQVEELIEAVRESGSATGEAAATNAAKVAELSGAVSTNSAKIADLEAGVAAIAGADFKPTRIYNAGGTDALDDKGRLYAATESVPSFTRTGYGTYSYSGSATGTYYGERQTVYKFGAGTPMVYIPSNGYLVYNYSGDPYATCTPHLDPTVPGVDLNPVSVTGTWTYSPRQLEFTDPYASFALESLPDRTWAAGAWAVGDLVKYDGKAYRCKADATSSSTTAPSSDTTHWTEIPVLAQKASQAEVAVAVAPLAETNWVMQTVSAAVEGHKVLQVWADGDSYIHNATGELFKSSLSGNYFTIDGTVMPFYKMTGSRYRYKGGGNSASDYLYDPDTGELIYAAFDKARAYCTPHLDPTVEGTDLNPQAVSNAGVTISFTPKAVYLESVPYDRFATTSEVATAIAAIPAPDLSGLVSKSGDTMTGPLAVPAVTIGTRSNGVDAVIGPQSLAQGQENVASAEMAHAEGWNTVAKYNAAHTEGSATYADQFATHAEGNSTRATKNFAHAEGNHAEANGNSSHAEGDSTHTVGFASHAEGFATWALGDQSHAEGLGTVAGVAGAGLPGSGAHSEGAETVAKALASHAEGSKTEATETAVAAHAEGVMTKVAAPGAHVEGLGMAVPGYGYLGQAGGFFSHVEGMLSTAQGLASHVEGFNAHDGSTNNAASFVWQGYAGHVPSNDEMTFYFQNPTNDRSKAFFAAAIASTPPYASHGPGTFNVNPRGGTSGFYVGEQSLAEIVDASTLLYDRLVPVVQTNALKVTSGNVTTYITRYFPDWESSSSNVGIIMNEETSTYGYDHELFTNRVAFVAFSFSRTPGWFRRNVVFPAAGVYRIDMDVAAYSNQGAPVPITVGVSCNGGITNYVHIGERPMSEMQKASVMFHADAGSGYVDILSDSTTGSRSGFALADVRISLVRLPLSGQTLPEEMSDDDVKAAVRTLWRAFGGSVSAVGVK